MNQKLSDDTMVEVAHPEVRIIRTRAQRDNPHLIFLDILDQMVKRNVPDASVRDFLVQYNKHERQQSDNTTVEDFFRRWVRIQNNRKGE